MYALIVGDDNDLNEYLSFALRRVGLEVNFRSSMKNVVHHWGDNPADFVLLSSKTLESPKELADLRRLTSAYLLVFIDQVTEELEAALLQAGADLVLHLPIGPKLLTAYLQTFLRRSQSAGVSMLPVIDLGNIVLNPASRTIQVLDSPACTLTQLEFRLLHLLMTHPGQVIPSDVIVDRVWGYGESGSKELIRGLVSRVRAKVEPDPSEPIFIHTLPGVGYLFEPNR